jgi:biotin synthase
MGSYANLFKKAVYNQHLSREEIIRLLSAAGEEEIRMLYAAADEVTQVYLGPEVHLRGIIEFSNHCKRNCLYCGIRRGNKKLTRYRMEPDEIVNTALNAFKLGYPTVVLQSGEDDWYTLETMCWIVKNIKKAANLAITLSLGEKSSQEYHCLKQAGADRYLMRFETSNQKLYKQLHPGVSYENRRQCLFTLRELGYELGTGFLVGLPGQTIADLAGDILLLQELDADMAGIGPFIDHPDTPLKGCGSGDLDMVLKVLAIVRLLMPQTNIPATTAVGTVDNTGRQRALKAGANVIMPNVTPQKYRELYQLYPGKICIDERPEHCRMCVEGIIMSAGKIRGTGFGNSPKWKERVAVIQQ